ncbi:MAG: hypothetical protein L0Y54_19725 [Sporichthyaceae bacterium]|nr:hypothetical protein [Sporichthyaceae bacterium]
MLSDAELAAFTRDGFVRVEQAVPAHTVQDCVEVIWAELARQGIDRHDPATWSDPVVRINCPEGGPFVEAGTAPPLGRPTTS